VDDEERNFSPIEAFIGPYSKKFAQFFEFGITGHRAGRLLLYKSL
jgi:hypothetical protein